MIIHLFPKSKFTLPYIEFINDNFDRYEHCFVLYSNGQYILPSTVYQLENVVDMDDKSALWLGRFIKKADKIIFHNLSVNIDVLAMMFLDRRIVRKSAWFIWGSDLYSYRNTRRNIWEYIAECMRKTIISQIPLIISWITEDCRLAKKWYKTNAVNLPVAYYDQELIDTLKGLKNKFKTQHNELRILLGNSATETNHHQEILEFLTKWNSRNMEIYAPLSYGDIVYGDKIEEMGSSVFGKKFHPLRAFMDKADYFRLISQVDVAIFNHDRQQALGNLIALLYLGKKVYLRKNTTMWNDLVNHMGFKIYSIDELYQIEFENLCMMEECDKIENYKIALSHYCKEERVKEWAEVFNYKI